MYWLTGLVLFSALFLLWLWWLARKAPEGHQDARGFHFGRPKRRRPSTPKLDDEDDNKAA